MMMIILLVKALYGTWVCDFEVCGCGCKLAISESSANVSMGHLNVTERQKGHR